MLQKNRKAYSATFSLPPSFNSESNKNDPETPK
jgi:hypothetical protein